MHSSFGFRVAAAFAGVGMASAAITAILVNLTFGSLFSDYVSQQQRAREAQIAAVLSDSYRQAHGWDPTRVQVMGPTLLMDGGELRITDTEGALVVQVTEDRTTETVRVQQDLMGTGPLGPLRSIPIWADGQEVGTVAVRLPAPGLQPHDLGFRDRVNGVLLFGGFAAGLMAIVLGIILARRATIPVRRLTAAANARARGESWQRVAYESEDEFGQMAVSFNSMADRLEEQEALRRTFAVDIAHELRTPLMVLRSQLEAMQDGVMGLDGASLASLHEEVLGLTRLVADLEVLASAAAAKFTLDKRPIDLRDEVSRTLGDFAVLYADRQLGVTLPPSPVVVNGDAGRIGQVLGNLLLNALKFTPSGGRVQVTLEVQGSLATIAVADSGPGIPQEEMAFVFDRFFRGRRTRLGGSGIGLSVVSELMAAHGGRVSVESPEAQGAVFRVIFPIVSVGRRTKGDLRHGRPAA